MKLVKGLLWTLGLGFVALVASLDLNGLGDWSANRVYITSDNIVPIDVDTPWPVEIKAKRPDPFGNVDDIILPADQYTLTMKPLDDHSEEFAIFSEGMITCSRRAILHVEFFIELLPDCDFQFMNSDRPRHNRFSQFIVVDLDPASDWQEIELAAQPRHIQRHMSVISRTARHDNDFNYFPWQPDGVVSNENVTLMTDACVTSLRGTVSLGGNYVLFDGNQDDELPSPPFVLGSPVTCIFGNQWILAGGQVPERGYDIPQRVFAFDLTTREWSKMPTLPDEIYRAEAIFERDGQLVVAALVQHENDGEIGPPATYVLREETWCAEHTSEFDFPVGNAFGVKTGVLAIATQNIHAAVKHLEQGRLQTIALAKGYSSSAPVTVIDNRVLQWSNDRVYELNQHLFLDAADVEN